MKIYEIRWKPSDDKKPTGNRAKVFDGAAACPLLASKIHAQNLWKSIKIYENPRNTMKVLRRRSQPGIEQMFLQGQQLAPYRRQRPRPKILKNRCKSITFVKIHKNQMIIYEISWKSSEDKRPAWNRAEVLQRHQLPCPKSMKINEIHENHRNQ